MKSPEAERQALLPPDRIMRAVSYSPPALDESARDFDIDFILVVIIPIIIILLFVLILSIIMCFGREGKYVENGIYFIVPHRIIVLLVHT